MPFDRTKIRESHSTGCNEVSLEVPRAGAHTDRHGRSARGASIFMCDGRMVRTALLLMLMGGWLSGCTLSGNWRAVHRPDDPQRPGVEVITFSTDGRFTMTSSDEIDRRTVTGTYSFAFGRLRLRPDREERPTYSGYRRPNGMLVVTGPEGPAESRVVLEKSGP